jgi:hypothetical protein
LFCYFGIYHNFNSSPVFVLHSHCFGFIFQYLNVYAFNV